MRSVGKLLFHLAHVMPDRSWFVGNVAVWPPANCNAVYLVNHYGFDALYIHFAVNYCGLKKNTLTLKVKEMTWLQGFSKVVQICTTFFIARIQ